MASLNDFPISMPDVYIYTVPHLPLSLASHFALINRMLANVIQGCFQPANNQVRETSPEEKHTWPKPSEIAHPPRAK